MKLDWSATDTHTLRTLWGQGLSGTEISRVIGCSRSAVLAKARREKLPYRPPGRNGHGPINVLTEKLVLCPCCGSPMAAPLDLEGLEFISLPKLPRRILEALIKVYPHGLTYLQLADRVYWDDPNGGPSDASNTLAVTVSRMRPQFEHIGWSIGAANNHTGIRLFKTTAAAEAA